MCTNNKTKLITKKYVQTYNIHYNFIYTLLQCFQLRAIIVLLLSNLEIKSSTVFTMSFELVGFFSSIDVLLSSGVVSSFGSCFGKN